MARSAESKELVGELITATTGFHRKEENFSISRQYVMSNLRFHRYLDVDRHKVNETLEGIFQKFTVHSEISAGDTLRRNVLQFLDVQAFERKDATKTDTHYALLSFLLDMSNSPSIDPHIPSDVTEQEQEFDDFDWYRYLTEDLEPLQTNFSDSSSDSEESDTEPTSERVGGVELREESIAQVQASTNDLNELLVSRYWVGESDNQLNGCTGIALDWSSHMSAAGSLEHTRHDCYLTEYQMIREVLWILVGTDTTFLFTWDEETQAFSIRRNVNLTHTTKPCVASALQAFTDLATKLCQLRRFVSLVSKGGNEWLKCRTYHAFSESCMGLLTKVDSYTTLLTTQIKADEATATLMSVYSKYKEYREIIDVLHSIYLTAVLPCLSANQMTVSAAATSLLMACNEAVNNASMVCSPVLLTVVKVFTLTLQPYLSIIDEWLTYGKLNDPYSEFVIKKKDSSSLDETFWETAVELTADSTIPTFSFSSSAALLLPVMLSSIAITGKSMEMLSQLGKLSHVIGKQQHSLHQAFTERLCEELGWCTDIDDDTTEARCANMAGDITGTRCTDEGSAVCDVIDGTLEQLESHTHVDSLLLSNITALFQVDNSMDISRNNGSLSDKSYNMKDLSKVMSDCLEGLIEERHRHVSQCLLTVLKYDCRLQHYMSMIKNVYLLEAGNIMSEFYWQLFDKIRHSEQWREPLSLNISIQECLLKGFPSHASRFTVSLTEMHRSEFLPIHALEEISLHYTVDWPIDVVYSSKCEEDYNRIFQFLLQIKLAKYSLDHLKFIDLRCLDEEYTQTGEAGEDGFEGEDTKRDFYLLRMKLLHFVNGIHDYIMRMVLHSAANDLQDKVQNAADLEAIIKAHRVYLTLIYNRCFLHDDMHVLHDCILRMLNIALVFQRLWDGGLTRSARRTLQKMAAGFTECLQNLTSFVTSLIKTGSLPHLESLALTLRMATP